MPPQNPFELEKVHSKLKSILKKFDKFSLQEKQSKDGEYTLVNTSKKASKSKGTTFASIQIMKEYVLFRLIPVDCFPELLDGISEHLKKYFQGTSHFHFKTVEPSIFNELATLTEKGFEKYKEQGWIE